MPKNALSHVPEVFRERVEMLQDFNREYADRYFNQLLSLEEYKHKHPTRIVVFKCSDGRILFAHFTGTPLGYLRNFRNLGGQFNMGWMGLQTAFSLDVHEAQQNKTGCLAVITYHKSKGDLKRGCAANNYNEAECIKNAYGFAIKMRRAYRDPSCNLYPGVVYPIVIGIETDEDALILHNHDNTKKLDLGTLPVDVTEKEMLDFICEYHPEMPNRMRLDLLPLLMKNVQHIASVRASSRPITELDHNEWILGIGSSSSFDWFHKPNMAILVGRFNPNIEKPIKKGLGVIKRNAERGFILMTGASYGQHTPRALALSQVKYYSRLGQEIIKEHHSEIKEYMLPLEILVDQETQLFEIV